MHTYSLYICNKVIRIHNECGKFVRFCRGYIIQEPAPEPDYVIYVSESEIAAQRILSPGYGVDMLEGFVILRKLTKYLLEDEDAIFVHGSVVAYKNSAYMFTAASGVGKTTHSKLWTSNLSDAYILNGDKPFISTGDGIVAWGSPWCGAERYNKNAGVPLKAICFLERAETNSMTEMKFEDALPLLARQTGNIDYSHSESRIHIMKALFRIGENIRFYKFNMNNFSEDAFMTSYQVLSKLD